MKLTTWLQVNAIPQRQFARDIDAHESTVSFWCKDRPDKRPNWIFLDRIAKYTGNKVMPNDFIPADGTTHAPPLRIRPRPKLAGAAPAQ